MELDIFLSVSVPEFRASLTYNGKLKTVSRHPFFSQRECLEKEVRKSQEKSSRTAAQHSGKGAQHCYVLYLELSSPWTSSKYYIFKIAERLFIKIHLTRFKIILLSSYDSQLSAQLVPFNLLTPRWDTNIEYLNPPFN